MKNFKMLISLSAFFAMQSIAAAQSPVFSAKLQVKNSAQANNKKSIYACSYVMQDVKVRPMKAKADEKFTEVKSCSSLEVCRLEADCEISSSHPVEPSDGHAGVPPRKAEKPLLVHLAPVCGMDICHGGKRNASQRLADCLADEDKQNGGGQSTAQYHEFVSKNKKSKADSAE